MPLNECIAVADEYKRDRTHAPTICNRELRKVCCPLQTIPANSEGNIDSNVQGTAEPNEVDLDDAEPFIASQIVKSKF